MENREQCLLCPFRTTNSPSQWISGIDLSTLSMAHIISFQVAALKLLEYVGDDGLPVCDYCDVIVNRLNINNGVPNYSENRHQLEPFHKRIMEKIIEHPEFRRYRQRSRGRVTPPLPPVHGEEQMNLDSASVEIQRSLNATGGAAGSSGLQYSVPQWTSADSVNGVVGNQQLNGAQPVVIFITSSTMNSPHWKLRHQCEHCLIFFQFKVTLIRHLKQDHQNVGSTTCTSCGFECLDNASILASRAHFCIPLSEQAQVVQIKPFRCEHCGDLFKRQQNFSVHLGKHDKALVETPGNCNFCFTIFPTQKKLQQHLTSHGVGVESDLKICPKCGMEFKDEREMLVHHAIIHLPNGCSICKRRFGLLSSLRRHITIMHTNRPTRGQQ